ncbi:MAG: ribose 5-phosphate isomerase B [Planctomycetes bacterium]|nr:ribose 5-phosphate isomerase B [Planctomycetota bacterium]
MKVAVGSDHRGYATKAKLVEFVRGLGHQVHDEGVMDCQSADYPDVAAIVGGKVADGTADRGILICGTGIGMAITANKFRGVRAATCYDEFTAEMCRRHNDVNVLCLSGDLGDDKRIDRIVEIWFRAEFEGGRHARRLEKIVALERRLADQAASSASAASQPSM